MDRGRNRVWRNDPVDIPRADLQDAGGYCFAELDVARRIAHQDCEGGPDDGPEAEERIRLYICERRTTNGDDHLGALLSDGRFITTFPCDLREYCATGGSDRQCDGPSARDGGWGTKRIEREVDGGVLAAL